MKLVAIYAVITIPYSLMIDYFLSIIHPNVKKEWDSFYPENEIGIGKFLYHSHSFPCFHNPVDRNFRFKDILHLIPEKYGNLETRDLLPVAPYRLMKHVLDNKDFIVEANKREDKYEQVIKLLDECPYGVTSVCIKHLHFNPHGGTRIPMEESYYVGLTEYENNLLNMGLLNFNYVSSFSSNEKSKRGERTSDDVKRVKNASDVSYNELDIFFEELYPYCDEIKSEQTRVITLLHNEDIEGEFERKIIDMGPRDRYYQDFLIQEGRENDSDIKKKEYCLSYLTRLDSFVSNKLSEEVSLFASQYPLGYNWFEKKNKDEDSWIMRDIDTFYYECIKIQDYLIQKNTTLLRYNELYAQYPDGINAYNDAHKIIDESSRKETTPSPEDIIEIEEEKWKEYQANGIIIYYHNQWLKSQNDYSRFCQEVLCMNSMLKSASGYNIPFKTLSYDGKEIDRDFLVWQFYLTSFCLDGSLDYSNNKDFLERGNHIQSFKERIRYFKKDVYDNLMSFIKVLHSQYGKELVVLFGTSGLREYETFNDFHFKDLKQSLSIQGIPYKEIDKESCCSADSRRYVIVEVITGKSQMEKICQTLLDLRHARCSTETNSFNQESFSNIVYISLYKELDSEEMQRVIDCTRSKIARQKQIEERRRAEERERQEAEQRHNNKQLLIQSKLNSKVSSWKTLPCGLPYYYLFYYYPTTCDFEATETEWAHRRLVWNFKNDPDKNISYTAHNIALNRVVSGLRALLIMTFGEDLLRLLTLVCLPASTQVKSEARYKAFSEKLCYDTGMKNGYDHTFYIKDGISKNSPNNPTGHSIQPKVTFDDWFKGKYVLLFDDVVTKGDTMMRYKLMLEEAGAIVVGGISIGQTKHLRIEH